MLYENAPLAYVAYDAERRVQHVNPAFVELSGYDEAEVTGLAYTAFAPDSDWVARYREAFDTAARGQVAAATVQTRRKDGTPIWVQATVRAVLDREGRPQGFFSVATDITSLKQAERALRESESL